MRPLTHMSRMLEFALNDPYLQRTDCLDLDLKSISAPWMTERSYHRAVPRFYRSNHPDYHARIPLRKSASSTATRIHI